MALRWEKIGGAGGELSLITFLAARWGGCGTDRSGRDAGAASGVPLSRGSLEMNIELAMYFAGTEIPLTEADWNVALNSAAQRTVSLICLERTIHSFSPFEKKPFLLPRLLTSASLNRHQSIDVFTLHVNGLPV